ncbi:hypothetical protein D9M71_472130 [compost metagenome]
MVVGNEDVVQEHLVEVVFAEHVVDRPHGDARGFHVDQELREAGVAVLLVARGGAQQGDHVVVALGAGGPDLLAGDAPAAVDLLGAGAHGGEVGADVRLAHADAAVDLAAGDAGADLRRQVVRRELHQQRAALAFGDPVGIHRRARGQQFFQHHVALQGAALMAAVAFRPGHAEPAAFAQLAAEGFVGAVPVLGALGGGKVFQGVGEKRPDFGAEGVGAGVETTGLDREGLHGRETLGVS